LNTFEKEIEVKEEKMPSFVIDEKCDGCKGGDKTACMYICPNDLMVLDVERMKAYNSEPDMCWECYNCVKICPTQAIEVRGYADFTPLGASVVPMRGSEDIMAVRSSGSSSLLEKHRKGRPLLTVVSVLDRAPWPMSSCLRNRHP
jgi:adenosine phosphosulfate reductase beta subunit